MKKYFKTLNKIDLYQHSKNYALGGFFLKGLAFLLIPVFTRLMTPAEYGVFSLFLSLLPIFMVLFSLNLHVSIRINILKKTYDESSFLNSISIFNLTWSLFSSIICVIFSDFLCEFFNISKPILHSVLISAFFSVFRNNHSAYLECLQLSKKETIKQIVEIICIYTLSIYVLSTIDGDKVLGRIYSILFVNFLLVIYIFYDLRKHFRFEFNKKYILRGLMVSLPLIPNTLSSHILSVFDRIIINQLEGSAQTGLFSFAYTIGMVIMLFIGAMNRAWLPDFFKCLNKKDYVRIKQVTNTFFKIICFISLGGIYFLIDLARIVAEKNYLDAVDIIPLIVLACVVNTLYQFYVEYLFYSEKTIYISISTFISAIVNIILNYWLIPIYGYKIAGLTTLLSYIVLFIAIYTFSKLKSKHPVTPIKGYLLTLVFLIMFVTFSYFLFNSHPFNIITLFLIKSTLLILFGFLILKKEIFNFLNKSKNDK